jgi:hypothetical protein
MRKTSADAGTSRTRAAGEIEKSAYCFPVQGAIDA